MGLFSKKEKEMHRQFIESIVNDVSIQVSIKNRAIDKAIDLLAKTLSSVELNIYKLENKKIKKAKEEIYYKLNVKPNHNDYGYKFWYNVWSKYFYDGEVLLFELNHKLYYADDFKVNNNVVLEKEFYNISMLSENNLVYRINRVFKASEVIHLKLSNKSIKDCLDSYYCDIGELISIASNHYISNNVSKWLLGIPTMQQPLRDPKTQKEITYEDYKNKVVGSLFSKKDSVTMLSKHFSLDSLSSNKSVSSEDFKSLKKDWEESIADSFLIPRDIYFGNKTEKSSSDDDFLTYAIKPHLKLLEAGLNSIIVKKENYLKGEKIKADIYSIKVHDIIGNANSLDKLYADGFSHNNILEFLGLEPIDEEWANEHRITKNYSDDVSAKGGDNSE